MTYATIASMAAVKKLVVANWKMNPGAFSEAKKLFSSVYKLVLSLRHTQTVVCPPAIYLDPLRHLSRSNRIALGAQDCFYEDYGAYTGQSSPVMLKNIGARFVIVGHSERRALGEDDATVGRKVAAAVRHGLTVILCIGESRRDNDGLYWAFLKNELEEGLRHVSDKDLARIVIAYEPIWAIGKGAEAMAPRELLETSLYIRKVLRSIFGESGLSVPILYGGSVSPENTAALLEEGQVQGLLVGRQSLDAKAFGEILDIVEGN
jgi:triosephosphate isomerase